MIHHIIKVDPNCHTPLQRVLKGDRTIQGYISGKGRLIVTEENGNKKIYEVGNNPGEKLEVDAKIGELMQWQADPDYGLSYYEICYPPYEDGRYENLD